MAFHVAEIAQAFPESVVRIEPLRPSRGVAEREHTDHRNLAHLLRPGRERCGEEAERQRENQYGSWLYGESSSSSLSSASACSSQKRMSISRYIVVAVVRCSFATCCLPVRW
jgi:hypothetical protein